jgi:hypothetical protein
VEWTAFLDKYFVCKPYQITNRPWRTGKCCKSEERKELDACTSHPFVHLLVVMPVLLGDPEYLGPSACSTSGASSTTAVTRGGRAPGMLKQSQRCLALHTHPELYRRLTQGAEPDQGHQRLKRL